MLVKFKDLRHGDEILYPHGSEFVHVRVIRPARPLFTKDKDKNRIPKIDSAGNQIYGNIWGSVNAEIKEWDHTNVWSNVVTHHKSIKLRCNLEEHNHEQYFKLNYCQIWLLNREIDEQE